MANSDFKLTSEEVQSITIFHLRGWLDAQSDNTLFDAVLEARKNGTQNLIIDLAELELMTSAGINMLHKIYKELHPSGKENESLHFKLCNAPAQIYRVLAITGFLQTVPMYESLQSALKSFE